MVSPTSYEALAPDDRRLSNAVLDALFQLRAVLVDAAWPQLYLHVARGGLFASDVSRAEREIGRLDRDERVLLELFGLGRPVEVCELATREEGLCESLFSAGLLRRDGEKVRTSGFVVVPVLGGMLLCGTPSTYTPGTHLGAKAYLGNDSLTLAGLLGPVKGRSVLDLGAGCGVQGLLAARGAKGAVLSDIDPVSLEMCALNAAFNEVEHPVRFVEGDLYSPVAGERFDLVVVLPPYVPVDEGAVTATAAGGRDGLSFIRRLLAGAPDVLEDGGELVMFAQLLCSDEEPLLCRELDTLAPLLDTTLTLYDHHPLQPYALELAGRVASVGEDLKTALARVEHSLRSTGANGVCTAAIRARRPVGAAGAPRRRRSVAPTLSAHDRLVVGASTTISRADGYLIASRDTTRYLDPVTFALIAELSADRSLAEAAMRAWGPAAGAKESFVEQAIGRLGPLYDEGLLETCDPMPRAEERPR